mmetsp:Transcript_74610/g.242333  ORF Transcript_74610/g.242333 Transcript_74610/m.242333 type:complete len:372 (+) Transcript_74610:75-1190(+)
MVRSWCVNFPEFYKACGWEASSILHERVQSHKLLVADAATSGSVQEDVYAYSRTEILPLVYDTRSPTAFRHLIVFEAFKPGPSFVKKRCTRTKFVVQKDRELPHRQFHILPQLVQDLPLAFRDPALIGRVKKAEDGQNTACSICSFAEIGLHLSQGIFEVSQRHAVAVGKNRECIFPFAELPGKPIHERQDHGGRLFDPGPPHDLCIRKHLPHTVLFVQRPAQGQLAIFRRADVGGTERTTHGQLFHGIPSPENSQHQRVVLAILVHQQRMLDIRHPLPVHQHYEKRHRQPAIVVLQIQPERGTLGLNEGERRRPAQALPDFIELARTAEPQAEDLLVLHVHDLEVEERHDVPAPGLAVADPEQIPHLHRP